MQKSVKKERKKKRPTHFKVWSIFFWTKRKHLYVFELNKAFVCLCHVCICEQYETEVMPGENIEFLTEMV